MPTNNASSMIRRRSRSPQSEGGGKRSTVDFSAETIAIECVSPKVGDGTFPVKRTVGDAVAVSADIYRHGHEVLGAALLHRRAGEAAWKETAMQPLPNDRWQASFEVTELGLYEFAVAAWVEVFASWRRDTERKQAAGQDISSDLVEGAALARRGGLKAEAARPPFSGRPPDGRAAAEMRMAATQARSAQGASKLPRLGPELLTEGTSEALAGAGLGAGRQQSQSWTVLVERERARYGAWYEMFPRSQGTEPGRSATLAECERRLPEIREMGFDVVYLPPIHPIGHSHRKGKNNSLTAAAGDPGSPYAIGSEAGGHDAVEPGLGTLDDFDHFVAACRENALEVALDVALNCSPDHPWVLQHPEWFYHRPDGSIKYAENPPKRYEDIYPLNFDGPAAAALAQELRRVLLFWAARGVRVFRVDNPHTKPLPFWQWLLAEVKQSYPDVVFLSEAFTRPKPMKRLAKLGFSQSYTYFTWRNTKAELSEYMTELALGPSREYFRPNFFVNTPDILPAILQQGGRPAFLFRMVLAATLAPSWGMYSGFELCENRALAGTEEYADSEKYEYKVWDWERPGHIKDWIGRVNRIRREHPALQRIEGFRLLHADNPEMLFYARFTPDLSDVLAIAVNLDPYHPQEGPVEIPGAELGLGDNFTVTDLLAAPRGLWRGRHHYLKLVPEGMPAAILHLQKA